MDAIRKYWNWWNKSIVPRGSCHIHQEEQPGTHASLPTNGLERLHNGGVNSTMMNDKRIRTKILAMPSKGISEWEKMILTFPYRYYDEAILLIIDLLIITFRSRVVGLAVKATKLSRSIPLRAISQEVLMYLTWSITARFPGANGSIVSISQISALSACTH